MEISPNDVNLAKRENIHIGSKENVVMNAGNSNTESLQLPYYAIRTAVPYSSEDRHKAICEAAYFRAERRGFASGHELDDWLAGEAEIKEQAISEG
jgi:hypothetical protein